MSLANLANGYYHDGYVPAFEGVTEADMAKYDIINGPMIMAMEAIQLLNGAFMDGVYTPNELVMEAALEGYSDVMEAGKFNKIKEAIKNAGHNVAEAFRKMGKAVRAFFSNIGQKIKKSSTDAIKDIKESKVSELEYAGPKYTHLDEIGAILNEHTPKNVFGKIKTFKDAITGEIKKKGYVHADGYRDDIKKAIADAKEEFGIKEGDSTSASTVLASYWRNGNTNPDDADIHTKISSSEAIKILSAGAKIYGDLDNVSNNMQQDYENYAKQCDELAKMSEDNDESNRSFSDAVGAWNAIASGVRECQSFMMTVLSTWGTAYNAAATKWRSAARKSSTNNKTED